MPLPVVAEQAKTTACLVRRRKRAISTRRASLGRMRATWEMFVLEALPGGKLGKSCGEPNTRAVPGGRHRGKGQCHTGGERVCFRAAARAAAIPQIRALLHKRFEAASRAAANFADTSEAAGDAGNFDEDSGTFGYGEAPVQDFWYHIVNAEGEREVPGVPWVNPPRQAEFSNFEENDVAEDAAGEQRRANHWDWETCRWNGSRWRDTVHKADREGGGSGWSSWKQPRIWNTPQMWSASGTISWSSPT